MVAFTPRMFNVEEKDMDTVTLIHDSEKND